MIPKWFGWHDLLVVVLSEPWMRWHNLPAAKLLSQPWALPTLQWVLLGFFLTPLAEAVLMGMGAIWARTRFRTAPEKFDALIIQITTVGKEYKLVRQTVQKIKAYKLEKLGIRYEIWVVIEPGHNDFYPEADAIITVPKAFKVRSVDKARALEYTRRLRPIWMALMGLKPERCKVLFVDDDTLPTKTYIVKAFTGDYDLCQGVTIPNRFYAGFTPMHFLLSHLDNIRTRNCLTYCSVTQGITGKPLFVHGEGLCITLYVEGMVTWNWPIIASDDLTFGTNAAHAGYRWGFFHEYIQLVSPWTWKDSLRQRWRWTWGNFDAIANREIMPRAAAWFKAAKYAFGLTSIFASTTGAVLLFFGIAKVPPQVHAVFWASLVLWVASYALCGWINSGGEPNRERFRQRKAKGKVLKHRARSPLVAAAMFWSFRVTQTIVAAILCPVTATVPAFVIMYSVLRGRPGKRGNPNQFVMIDKGPPS